MIGYHGTTSAIATDLATGKVDVAKGGGELGRGFYTAEHLYVAKAWSTGRHGARKKNVVKFIVPDEEVDLLDIEIFNGPAATLHRSNIRRAKKTRTYEFGCDMVWSPIIGKESIISDQYKWESSKSEALLNGTKVPRSIL